MAEIYRELKNTSSSLWYNLRVEISKQLGKTPGDFKWDRVQEVKENSLHSQAVLYSLSEMEKLIFMEQPVLHINFLKKDDLIYGQVSIEFYYGKSYNNNERVFKPILEFRINFCKNIFFKKCYESEFSKVKLISVF